MNHDGSSFLSGAAVFSNALFFSKMVDDMGDSVSPNATFFLMRGDNWSKYDTSVGWPALDMTAVQSAPNRWFVVAVGPQGEYWELDAASTEETVGILAE